MLLLHPISSYAQFPQFLSIILKMKVSASQVGRQEILGQAQLAGMPATAGNLPPMQMKEDGRTSF